MRDWLNRRNWLEGLFAGQIFDFVFAPLIVSALSCWLIADFIKTRRAVKRGEPLRIWYLRDPVYPGDFRYSYFAFQREYPALILFGAVGIIVLGLGSLIIWIAFWPPTPHP